MVDQSQTSTDLSVYVGLYGGLHKVLTLPANVLLAVWVIACTYCDVLITIAQFHG